METKSTGQIIKEILEQKGISQKELAVSAGVTEAAMSHYIKGDRIPRGANLLNIAKALGTTTNILLGEPEVDDISYEQINTLVARKAKDFTKEQKKALINLILAYHVLQKISWLDYRLIRCLQPPA